MTMEVIAVNVSVKGTNLCCSASTKDTNNDQRINSAVYGKVLSEPTNFPLSVSPSKEMGDRTNKEKNL